MCHSDAENGIKNAYYFKISLSLIHFDAGKKASKIQSEYSNNVPPGKQQLTMDEALSKTSK